ncbi:MAG: 50S ribosomal protein L24 [Candidatus Aenigmarchaeota archaeon]|nr:50S ribosomal protein L24 [Candidatus Aenigmarchaeota archaeon]
MKEFSIKWKSSTQPRKQRKYRYNAPTHVRRALVSAHLEKSLRKEYGKRSLPVRKGDEVRVMTGEFRGVRGKVSRVDLKSLKIYVENAKVKKVSGQEVEAPIDPSNVMITKLEFEDKKRRKFIARKKPAEAGGNAKK